MNSRQAVLLIHAGGLGDFVLAVHLARTLVSQNPNRSLHTLCRNRVACYFAQNNAITAWKHIEHPKYAQLFAQTSSVSAELSRYFERFDLVLSMLGLPGSTTHELLAQHTRIASIDPRARGHSADQIIHITEQWSADYASQGVEIAKIAHQPIVTPQVADPEIDVLIHPGSGSDDKCWGIELFVKLSESLRSRGLTVKFMIGPDERERWHAEVLRGLEPYIFEADVCDAAAMLPHTKLVIGNDSGMLHLAAAPGVRCLSIFTVTRPEQWQPIGADVDVLVEPDVSTVITSADRILDNVSNLRDE